MKNPVIVSAVRTIAGRFGGSLSSLSAADLGAAVVKEVVKRAGITGEDADQLVFGCGWQAGLGPNVARIAAVREVCRYQCRLIRLTFAVLPACRQ